MICKSEPPLRRNILPLAENLQKGATFLKFNCGAAIVAIGQIDAAFYLILFKL